MKKTYCLLIMLAFSLTTFAIPADDVKQAQNALNKEREALLKQINEKQINLLKKAISLENDYQTAANLHIQLRTIYADFDDVRNAIQVAESYANNGPVISTYLRDRVDEAKVFSAAHKAFLGDRSELQVLSNFVKQKPQNYHFRALYSDALFANKNFKESIENMNEVQRILRSTGNDRADFNLRIGESLVELGQIEAANECLNEVLENVRSLDKFMGQRLVKALFKLNRTEDARKVFDNLPKDGTVAYEKQRNANLEKY